jgi:hypothetical protein
MTFAEYNTDENFDKDKSSLDELVKIGLAEGKTSDEIKNSLSPKWQKSKKIGEFDNYVSKYSAPKAEEKVKETVKEKEAPKVEEEKTGIKTSDKNYMNDINAILNEEQKQELEKLSKTSVDAYNRTMENMERSGEAFKRIDDKLIAQLPTFLFKRYANGEFGDISDTSTPEGRESKKNAQLRLAHFVLNGLQSKLKNASNAAAIAAGRTPMFSDTMSDYEKYQQTNLAQGLENRWNKYKAETDSAVKMVQERNVSEEDALNILNKISMNNRLQNAFNMADANKKAYMIEVLSKVGDKVSNWNDQKFINALVGAEMTGEDVGNAAALIGARAGEKIIDNFNLFDENGNLDLSALKTAMNIPGFTDKFKAQFGFDPNNLIPKEGEDKGTGTTLEDGTKVDPGKYMNSKEYKELVAAGDKLSQQYYNGEIDEAKFRSEYAKLEKIMSEHGWFSFFRNKGIASADDLIKVNNKNNLIKLSDEFDTLNNNAKNYTKDEYLKKYDELKARGVKWGISEKDLKSVEKAKDKALKKTKK